MEIKLLSKTKAEMDLWDQFVSSSFNGTIFQTSIWLNACDKEYDIWGVFKGKDLVGGFVAPYRTFFGNKLVANPFLTPYSGLVFVNHEGKYVGKISNEKEISIKFAKLLREEYKWGFLYFDPLIIDMQPFIWGGFKVYLHYTYILDITDLEKTWDDMRPQTRHHIRKAQKDGLTVVAAESFDEVIAIVEKTFRRQNISRSFNIAYNYYNEFSKKNLCKGFICLDGYGMKIATCFIVWDGKRVYAILSGYDSEKGHHGSTALCFWEAIKYASKEIGYKEFDFEGSMVPQIEQSFRGFGGKLTPNYGVMWGKGISLMLKVRFLLNNYLDSGKILKRWFNILMNL
jgi:hypothetical protein